MKFEQEKKQIIYWANLLNERGLVSARSGNISFKVEEGRILITAHDSYLGQLDEQEIILIGLDGKTAATGYEPTSEKNMHLDIHNKFKDTKVILHAHSPYTTAFFHYFNELELFSFEAKFYLGKIPVIPQNTPTVTDTEEVIEALEVSNIVVLKDHGVVAMGKNFKEAFSLIELLEEQAKVNLLLRGSAIKSNQLLPEEKKQNQKESYRLLSSEHAQRLKELVNNDKEAQELGKKYGLTCTLAVKNKNTGEVMRFSYQEGKIISVDNKDDADFIIIGGEEILKKVFNREIDPFVASTQGKVTTKGDFSKMSKWYPVLVRTFKLWEQAPVK